MASARGTPGPRYAQAYHSMGRVMLNARVPSAKAVRFAAHGPTPKGPPPMLRIAIILIALVLLPHSARTKWARLRTRTTTLP
jgi:hypothetical protein